MYNWRWVFFVNLPFGILAVAGLALFMPRAERNPGLRAGLNVQGGRITHPAVAEALGLPAAA